MTWIWSGITTHWSFDLQVWGAVVLAVVLYVRGARSLSLSLVGSRRAAVRPAQALAFFAGLTIVIIALESPVDWYDGQLFWTHMLQHLLLIMVAAPLLILGDPAIPLLRGIPLALRRRVLGAAAGNEPVRHLGHVFSWLSRPRQVFVLFILDLYLWHWNWLFNLTLQNGVVHDLEHVCFLGTALLFWSQIIDQRPMHARMSYLQRALYTVLTAAAGNFLAMYFVFTQRPVYAAYAAVAHRPFGISAVTDQQFAGALMWIPVLFLFGGAFVICLYKALSEESAWSETPVASGSYSVLLAPGDTSPGQWN